MKDVRRENMRKRRKKGRMEKKRRRVRMRVNRIGRKRKRKRADRVYPTMEWWSLMFHFVEKEELRQSQS